MFINTIILIWCVSIIIIFFKKTTSILNSLLLLELMMLFTLFFILINFLNTGTMELIFFILVLAVSEAVIGLSVLTRFMQFYGNDKFSSMVLF